MSVPASPIASDFPNPPASEWITSAMDKVSSYRKTEGGKKVNLTYKLSIASSKSLETFTCNEILRLHKRTKLCGKSFTHLR